MRRVLLDRINTMIPNEPDTVFMTVDIGMWAIREVLEKYPDRCMNIGIFEDAMMSVAAGMSSRGLYPTIFGIQPYLIERAFEQIKMELAYQKFGVNVIGTGAAVDYSKYGYSHYCAEDVALIKQLPGVEFITPGSAREFKQLFEATYRNGHPTFFRISDHPNKKFELDVQFGKANVIKKGSKATVISVSVTLDMVMEVCKDLDVTVLYYTTLEPFDYETLSLNCESKKILVVEPEFEGSLLYDIHRALPNEKLLIEHVAFPHEIFRNYGTYDDKQLFYGFTPDNVKGKLDSIISR